MIRHPYESGGTIGSEEYHYRWIPAFAGMTFC